ncbi:MAG: hypothetical protein ACLPYW_07045 [Acidimicrobiales bacterium]
MLGAPAIGKCVNVVVVGPAEELVGGTLVVVDALVEQAARPTAEIAATSITGASRRTFDGNIKIAETQDDTTSAWGHGAELLVL